MLRFGVIGTNWITDRFIAAARESKDFALTAVYSRTEEQASQYAEKHQIAHRYTDLEQFAASTEFDAVYLASPNSLHADHAVLCMDNGKHVLCEKPIASNKAELDRMIDAAKRNGVALMEALVPTMLPAFGAIKDNLHKLGRIRRYAASYCQYSSRYDAYKEGQLLNAFNPIYSNGAMMDLGIYCIYPLVALLGAPERVQASAVMLDSGVDGEGSLLLAYPGCDAVIHYSKITTSYAMTEIQGEQATMIIDKINTPEHVEIRYRDGTVENLTRPLDHSFMFYEVQHFIEMIERKETQSATNSWHNSRNTLGIMDEARRQIGLVYPADLKHA
ncbi:MAG: Gfo/Idh/MocA family oxidoreductase [Candidatus Cohnella colombiensis]|uniref:Gfo/Idh/MocA family oxidoreductase n=1 Tax=Candidatus Cohnella colombiensis TaxID=3121368 RepID=A0AA95EUW0_9BACL|nr:MAG: Gfo/Idh/MocA family oxidoreductase [Cohnella sp.]